MPGVKPPAFRGHTFTRRPVSSKRAMTDADFSIPLQQTDVAPMKVEVLREMMNRATRRRFDELWAMISKAPLTPGRAPSERLRTADATTLLRNGIIQPAGALPTKGWVIPFTVIEKKGQGYRRRFILHGQEIRTIASCTNRTSL